MITYILIAINILLYLVPTIMDGDVVNGTGPRFQKLLDRGASQVSAIQTGQYYRIITSSFLHANLIHLLFNMYSLYNLGFSVNLFFSDVNYILIYIFSALSGGLTAFIVNLLNSNRIPVVGASGAVFGLIGALIALSLSNPLLSGNLNNLLMITVINLIYGFMTPNISNASHIGGLVGGFLISYVFLFR